MNKIILVGLGTNENDLTVKAQNLINSSLTKIVRTSLTLSANSLKKQNIDYVSLDSVYEKSRNFDTLNKNLAKEVISYAKNGDVVYFVDGSVNSDNSCKEIIKKHKNVEIYTGVSYADKTFERLKICEESYMQISAYDILNFDTITPKCVVYAITSKQIASNVKLKLMDVFGEEIKIYFTDNSIAKEIYLYELDWQDSYDYSTTIYIPFVDYLQKTCYEFYDLVKIVTALRSENGCPWDKVQTYESLQKNLIEECYELVDAINSNDVDNIIEEIGDVLLQCVFYAVLGQEDGKFNINDAVNGICSKLISRHTHVFGKDSATSATDALSVWNKNKAKEKGYKNGTEYLLSVPKTLPALMKTQKVTERASKYNFDFENLSSAIDKIYEEIKEVEKEYNSGDDKKLMQECGDLIFSVVNVCRLLKVDSESALITSLDKFLDRFSRLEKVILADGKDIKKMTASEIDEYYIKIKGDKKCN